MIVEDDPQVTLHDAAERAAIATEFTTTFFVEAAAGTGKTTALVGRIVSMVRLGVGTLARTVAVTFTEPAAGEMKLRLRLEIEKARRAAVDPVERSRLDRALEELELARISTIHAFCGDLLRERPLEAGVDPAFKLLSEEESQALADQAFDRWLQRILADPPEGPRRILRRRSGNNPPQDQLRGAMHGLLEHRDFPTEWRRDPFDRNAAIDVLMEQLAEVGEIAQESSWSDDYLTQCLRDIAVFVREATRLEGVQERDYDGLEAELRELSTNKRRYRRWENKGSPKTLYGSLSHAEVLDRRDAVRAALQSFVAACEADLAPLLHIALREAVAGYDELKAKVGALDFLDLLIKARNLVRDDRVVRRTLQDKFSHFFVDEFQDTDPLQAEILLLLASDDPDNVDWQSVRPVAGKLFVVGDPKQAIYRFRRADVSLYEDIKNRLCGLGAQLLRLSTSFRAPPSIQLLVNTTFARAMAEDEVAAEYVPLRPYRSDITERPTIVALPAPSPYADYGKVNPGRISDSLPDAVAAFVNWLVNDSHWQVEEKERRVDIQPRHIAILFRGLRSFDTDLAKPYLRALEARHVPHVLMGGRSFHDREEVVALRTAIAAIEWPDDELKVFATLRGPFFSISDEALLIFRQESTADGTVVRRRLDPMRRLDKDTVNPEAHEVIDALALLRDLHKGRNRRPIAQTITMFMHAVRAHAGIALWQNGEQALANCQRLIDMARRFERETSSFRAFVERMEAQAEGGETNEAPVVEEGTEGVRVMTVHKAKGLEFPVVILADPTYKTTRRTASRHVDPKRSVWLERLCGAAPIELQEANALELARERAENVRVVYVAATRAQELLVVPTCGDEPVEGWLDLFNPLLYPADTERRSGIPAPSCPEFGDDSVLERGPNGKVPPGGSVRPGLYPEAPERPAVVWWDPATLKLEVDELAALRHERLLASDDAEAAAESERAYAAWRAERDAVIARAGQPSLLVETVTSRVRSQAVEVSLETRIEVKVEHVARGEVDRSGGRRFGALAHAIIAATTLDSDSPEVARLASANGRMLGATAEEVGAVTDTVRRTLDHPILRRASSVAATDIRRETPVMLELDDHTIVEGVVDLAFRERTAEFDGWTVVDFKTDREFENLPDAHLRQVRLYALAISKATGLPVRGVVLVI